jgi:glucose/arabinose dehydrogenase
MRDIRLLTSLAIVVLALGSGTDLLAQQRVALNPNNGFPVAPQGLTVPPLPGAPVHYETAEGQDIRVSVVARGLTQPWSMAFLPGGDILVTERGGALRVIRNGSLDPSPVPGLPQVRVARLAGLHDIVRHPDFAANGYLYFSYNRPDGDAARLVVGRARFDGEALVDVGEVFVAAAGISSSSRLAFDHDGLLYVSVGGGDAQDPMSQGGKVLRLRDDGAVPDDNPFVGRAGYLPEIYTLGHRNTLGLAVHPGTGEVWQNENGPNGGDEINVLRPGANYGWPLISLGRTYPGPRQSVEFSREGFENPIVYWTPSIAVSGMAFYTGDALPKWTGDVFVGALRTGEIPGTGHLQRILFNEEMQELRRESLLVDLRQRIRDVRQGPDGLLYVLTGEDDGALLRIEPGGS